MWVKLDKISQRHEEVSVQTFNLADHLFQSDERSLNFPFRK